MTTPATFLVPVRKEPAQPQVLSSTSGAAKKRAAKAATAAVANGPPSLIELIQMAIRDDFSKRTVRSFYHSMLRAKVKTLDAKLGKRSFGAKDEWTQALGELQKEGVLTHTAATDTITLPDAV